MMIRIPPQIWYLPTHEATLLAGRRLAHSIGDHVRGGTIFLQGALGAGKTTFVRGLLNGYGYHGIVRSPTYTLVETYDMEHLMICHIDLYRLSLGMLESIGIRDYLDGHYLCLIEWPERAIDGLPAPHICCDLEVCGEGRLLSLMGSHQVAGHHV